MRELLFRGQQRKKGEKVRLDGSPVESSWFYGNGIFQTGIIINECATFGVGISPYVDWDYLDSKIHTITGCDNNPHFCRNDNFCSLWELMCNYNQGENDCSVVEVIGNIYDNSELLDGGAE